MKKQTLEGQQRIRDKAAKRWLKDRPRIIPAISLFMLFGFVIGGQLTLDLIGAQHAWTGAIAGALVGAMLGGFYVVNRTA